MVLSAADVEQRDALSGRIAEAALGAFDLLAIHLGLDLGLYQALADQGPATSSEMASRAGIDERYVREWLEQQAVTGILTVEDASAPADARVYLLSPGHAETLLDPDSLAAAYPMPRYIVAAARMLSSLEEAYRTGAGVAWEAYPGVVGVQEASNRAQFRKLLVQEWLPAIPDIHARLSDPGRPARVADLACGAGWSSIAIAVGYPSVQVDGLDIDPDSIATARRNAASEAVDEGRLRFHLVDAAKPELDGQFDLVTIFEAVHDMSDPVAVLGAARRLLAPGGAVLIADEKVAEAFEAPGDDVERMMYGYSLFFCLANGRIDVPSVATGTVMRPDTLRGYASAAGFSGFSILPIEHETFRFYRLEP